MKSLDGKAFTNCSSLLSVDCRNVLKTRVTEGFTPFSGCLSLASVNLKSMEFVGTTANINSSRSMFYRCQSLKRLILSAAITSGYLSAESTPPFNLLLLDIGPSMTNYLSTNIDNNGILVMRGAPSTSGSTTKPSKIFVPAQYLNDYKTHTNWSVASSKIFAIGGAEWIAEYGSANEYANLTEQEYLDNYADS